LLYLESIKQHISEQNTFYKNQGLAWVVFGSEAIFRGGSAVELLPEQLLFLSPARLVRERGLLEDPFGVRVHLPPPSSQFSCHPLRVVGEEFAADFCALLDAELHVGVLELLGPVHDVESENFSGKVERAQRLKARSGMQSSLDCRCFYSFSPSTIRISNNDKFEYRCSGLTRSEFYNGFSGLIVAAKLKIT